MDLPNTGSAPFSQHPKLAQSRLVLRVIWGAMVMSMGVVSFVFSQVPPVSMPNFQLFQLIATVVAVMSFVIPGFLWNASRKMKRPEGESFEARFGQIFVTHIFRFALTEAALILLLISSPSHELTTLMTYFGAAVALMIFHYPKDDRLDQMLN
jgi:hypothetical protein